MGSLFPYGVVQCASRFTNHLRAFLRPDGRRRWHAFFNFNADHPSSDGPVDGSASDWANYPARHCSGQPCSRSLGFSLMEVLISISVIAVVGLLAAPSLSSYYDNQQLRAAKSSLDRALRYARSQAQVYPPNPGAPNIFICALNTAQNTCNSATANWNNGWRVYADNPNAANTGVLDGADTLLKQEAIASPGSIVVNTNNIGGTVLGFSAFNVWDPTDPQQNPINPATPPGFSLALNNSSPSSSILLTVTGHASSYAPVPNSDNLDSDQQQGDDSENLNL